MKTLEESNKFRKDLIRQSRRGKNLKAYLDIAKLLLQDKELLTRCRPHKLSGNWSGYWECHIEPDWLLIYQFDQTMVTMYRTGTHSDLF